MRSIVTDIDVERPCDGEYYTIYLRQGKLVGNMLMPQESLETGKSYMEAAQAYLDAHAEEIPNLADLPNLEDAGAVTQYLVEVSQDSDSGMVFIGNDSEKLVSLITELHERDNRIHTFDDVMKKLEEAFQKIPSIRDYIECSSLDEYIPRGEPLLHSYTGLASVFACTVAVAKGKAQEAAKKANTTISR